MSYRAITPKAEYATPGNNYYSAGAVGSLDGKGLVFGAVWMSLPLHGATSVDECFWRNRPRDIQGYLPNCGGLEVIEPGNLWDNSATIDYGAGTNRPFRMYYGAWQPFYSGFKKPGIRYGHSVVVESASIIEDIGSLALWLTY